MFKRILPLALIGAAAAFAAPALALPPFTTAAKSGPASGLQAQLAAVSVSRHATFDRIVLRFKFARPGYQVRYVPKIIADGSGLPVAVLGSGKLLIRLEPARAHTVATGSPTVARRLTPLFPALRQLKISGDFEGVVSFGAGINGQKPFRVFTLTAPQRIVVDIQH